MNKIVVQIQLLLIGILYLIGNKINLNLNVYKIGFIVLELVWSIVIAKKALFECIFFMFVFNGLIRRIFAPPGEGYIANDFMILLPIIFMVVYLLRSIFLRNIISLPKMYLLFEFSTICISLLNIFHNSLSITIALLTLIIGVRIGGSLSFRDLYNSRKSFNLVIFYSNCYLFSQIFGLNRIDFNWCNNRITYLTQLTSCAFPNIRLWGTMESPANMGFILSIGIINLVSNRPKLKRMTWMDLLLIAFYYLGILLTGTRTFLWLLPLAILITSGLRSNKISSKILVISPVLIILSFTITKIASKFGFTGGWLTRLNIFGIATDSSFKSRSNQVSSFMKELNFRTLLFGDGVGSHSRGITALDNGILVLILELGLPIAMILLVVILLKIHLLVSDLPNLEFVLSVLLLYIIGSSSFAVISGSLGFLFSFCLGVTSETKTRPDI